MCASLRPPVDAPRNSGLSFITIWCRSGSYTHFAGPVTAADLLEHVLEIAADPRFDDLRFSILDFRDATDAVDDSQLSPVYAQLIGQRHSNDRIRVAAVTTDPQAIAHLDNFSAKRILPQPIQVFAEKETAFAWAHARD